MAGKTYKTRGIVLRKTKLGEKDLVVTMLDESGSLRRAVAKGARKPGGSYAARLELFSVADIMCAEGRSLDVVTSAKLVSGATLGAFGVEQSACASVLAEMLAMLAQEDLPHERLYAMARAAFGGISCEQPPSALSLTCSALLKALAYAGFRPSFSACVSCGAPVQHAADRQVALSVVEGGVLCPSCARPADAMPVDAETVRWADALMLSRFDEVLAYGPPLATLFDILHFIRQWTNVHVGKNLKSLDFLLTCGLF